MSKDNIEEQVGRIYDILTKIMEPEEEDDYKDVMYTANQLILQGVLAPPCKTGDLFFCVIAEQDTFKKSTYHHVEACRVDEIKYFQSGSFLISVREVNSHLGHNVTIGKDAFKTYEEAEAIMLMRRNKEGA